MKLSGTFFSYLLLLNVSFVHAQVNEEISEFIEKINVKNYDCPTSEFIPQLDEYLNEPLIAKPLLYSLQTEKTHWMICEGQYDAAQRILYQLIEEQDFDKASRAFASAIYQIGFIYDTRENDERCGYYRQAEILSKDKFDDIYLSAQLGQITVCNVAGEIDGIKLGRLYALLELYLNKGDKPAVAHIHNNIGLFYGKIGQYVLAAEQYQKAYELGLDVYKGSNLLATLISVVTSQMASGNYEGAKTSIEQLKRDNMKVNTPLTNVWVHFSESGYYYRTGDFESLKDSLLKWRVFLDQINSSLYEGLYRWYHASLCLHEQNRQCILEFLAEEEDASKGYKAFVQGNKDYVKLQVEIQLFLRNIEKAQEQFKLYTEVMVDRSNKQQASGKVLGVANLHGQIINLESSLAEVENQKIRSIAIVATGFTLLLVGIVYFFRRKHLAKLAADPLTGLRNTRDVINMIKRVNKPTPGKTNAIALFDLDNFKEVNSQFGHITADMALQNVASTLKQVTRDHDILGRLASEQFIVCMTNIEESTAKAFFERISQALQNTILSAETGDKVNLRSSMSIYVSTDTFDDLDDVLTDMQRAMSNNGYTNGSLG